MSTRAGRTGRLARRAQTHDARAAGGGGGVSPGGTGNGTTQHDSSDSKEVGESRPGIDSTDVRVTRHPVRAWRPSFAPPRALLLKRPPRLCTRPATLSVHTDSADVLSSPVSLSRRSNGPAAQSDHRATKLFVEKTSGSSHAARRAGLGHRDRPWGQQERWNGDDRVTRRTRRRVRTVCEPRADQRDTASRDRAHSVAGANWEQDKLRNKNAD